MKTYYKIKAKLDSLFNRPSEVPSYETKRQIISQYRDKFKTKLLVETGTFFGDTVEYFKTSFDKVISIELAQELASKAKLRFEKDDNVEIMQGDSGRLLPEIISNIKEPILFWLDGHYSSEFFVGDEFIKTARTDKDTPVEEELRAIFASDIDHVILIDDARLFNGVSDYPDTSQLKKTIRKSGKLYSMEVKDDIIRITPKIMKG